MSFLLNELKRIDPETYMGCMEGKIEEYQRTIDEQDTLIKSQKREIFEFIRIIEEGYESLVCDRTGLNEHQDLPLGIQRMANQIATLQAAIRKERLMAIDRNIGNLAFRKSMVNDQLARELPEIDWSDVK